MRIVQHRTSIVGTDRSVVGNDQSILGSIVIGIKRSTLASSINCWGCWNQDSSINRSLTIVGTDPRPSIDRGIDRSIVGTDSGPSFSRLLGSTDRSLGRILDYQTIRGWIDRLLGRILYRRSVDRSIV